MAENAPGGRPKPEQPIADRDSKILGLVEEIIDAIREDDNLPEDDCDRLLAKLAKIKAILGDGVRPPVINPEPPGGGTTPPEGGTGGGEVDPGYGIEEGGGTTPPPQPEPK